MENTEFELRRLAEDREIYASMFFTHVANLHEKGHERALRQCLIRSIYPCILSKYENEPVFRFNDGQWLSKWREMNRWLPEKQRLRNKPSFRKFCEGLTLAAKHSNLRIGQMLCWLTDSQASELFKLESKFHKLGTLEF